MPTIVPNDVAIVAAVLWGEQIESGLQQEERLRTEKQPRNKILKWQSIMVPHYNAG